MDTRALGVLADVSQKLLDEGCQDSALRQLTDAALSLMRADHASLRLCSADGRLEVGARSGIGCERPALLFQSGEGVVGWVAKTGQAVRIGDSRHDPRFVDRRERGYPVGSVLSVPVRSGESMLGVLTVSSPGCDAFTEDDEIAARLLASTAAQTLRATELRRLALTDSQTLAYNRSYLLPQLRREMERAARQLTPLSVLLMDLDHFKRVNDTFGHAIGDDVLRAFADITRSAVRAVDTLVRRGGGEFVLIMPATSERQAWLVAERVRQRVCAAPLPARGQRCVPQTISIGVATWNGLEGPESLDERADVALYEAKRTGRNRTVIACETQDTALCAPPSHALTAP
jgi:diguanylate cyclase (GGDEF)-like protein